jgi:hypothetical protein
VSQAEAFLEQSQSNFSSAEDSVQNAQFSYTESLSVQSQKGVIIEEASVAVINKQSDLQLAQDKLKSIDPYIEPVPEVTPEPTPEEPVVEEPQTAVEQAQEQLEERAAENDTGVLPYTVADAVTEIQAEEVLEALTDPSLIANAIGEGIAEAAAFVGELLTEPGKAVAQVLENVSQAGLDMSDDQREKAQEVIVPVVIVSQIASMMVGRIK